MSELSVIARRIYGGSARTLFIRVVGIGLLFASHLILANFLGASEYGTYSFVLATTALLAHFAALGLPTGLLRLVAQYEEQKRLGELKGALRQIPLVAILSSIVVSAILGLLIRALPENESLTEGLRLSALVLPLFVLDQIRRNLFSGFRLPVAGTIPDEVIRPVILGVAVWLFSLSSALVVVKLHIAVSLASSAAFLWWLYRSVAPPLSAALPVYYLRRWLVMALPMSLGHVSHLVMNRTDVVMLGFLDSMQAAGIYAAANRVSMLSQVVLGTAAMVVAPLLTAAYHGGRVAEFRSIMNHTRIWISIFVAPLFLAMMLLPVPIMRLFGDEYVGAANLLRLLALGQLANAIAGPVGIALLMTDRQKLLGVLTFAIAMANVALNLIAIPKWGAVGAATVTALCIISLNLTLTVVLERSRSYRPAFSK